MKHFKPLELLWLIGFIECFTATFLHTHSWLNWVDEDDWWGWGWLERKPEYIRYIKKITPYIKIWPEAPGVRAKDWIPNFAIIGNCGLGESAGVSHLKAPSAGGGGGGWNPSQVAPTTGSLILVPPQTQPGVQSFST